MRPILRHKAIWDLCRQTHIRGWKYIYRLVLRVRNADGNRSTFKMYTSSLNVGRSWDRKCIESAHDIGLYDILLIDYSISRKLSEIRAILHERDCTDWLVELNNDRNLENGYYTIIS